MARDLLRRWWGLEMGLTDAKGGGYDRTSHKTCESVKGLHAAACAKELTDLAVLFAKTKERGAVARTCHAGMTIVAAPVLGVAGLLGVVFATGGHDEDPTAMEHGVPIPRWLHKTTTTRLTTIESFGGLMTPMLPALACSKWLASGIRSETTLVKLTRRIRSASANERSLAN